jgi:arylsulfatase
VDLLGEDRPFINALYDGEARVFDDMVGRWIAKLEKLGILDDTLIIITADHGEELMERGHVGHCSCNLKGTLYEESIRVPLIMRLPGKLPAGKVIDKAISQIDIMPTLFEMLGLAVPDSMEGSSLLPLIHDEAVEFREVHFAQSTPAGWQALADDDREIYCVRTARWKLVLHTDGRRSTWRYELYDLASDPGERCDVFDDRSDITRELMVKLKAYVGGCE